MARDHPLLAQLVEQVALNDKVVGSSPTGGTREKDSACALFSIRVPDGMLYFSLVNTKSTRSRARECLV